MKILDIDWIDFLESCATYHRLPHGARKFVVQRVQPTASPTNEMMGRWREPLLASGLMVAGPKRVNAKVTASLIDFVRVIRTLGKSTVFSTPTTGSFIGYVREHLHDGQISSFAGRDHGYYYPDYEQIQTIAASVCTAGWVKGFLAATSPEWERKYLTTGEQPYFASIEVLREAQTLVSRLAQEAAPIPLARARELCAEMRPDRFTACLRAAFRYLFLFPALYGDGLEPVVGLWPGVGKRLSGARPKPPNPGELVERFQTPFLAEDMAVILAGCAVDVMRVRKGDYQIFDSARERIADELGSLPEWVEQGLHYHPDTRIDLAMAFLENFDFLERTGVREQGYRASPAGMQWMGLSAQQRLKVLVDGLLGKGRRKSDLFDDEIVAMVPSRIQLRSDLSEERVAAHVVARYAGLPADESVNLGEFFAYHREEGNPFIELRGKSAHRFLSMAGRYWSQPTEDDLEEAWTLLLSDFLGTRLVPLGGAAVGVDRNGALCFAITGVGRYLLGAAQDFDLDQGPPGRVVVQPNFDVVFLAPSAKAESEIARFCERKGRHVGALFKITRQSILAAAAARLTPEAVMATLREHCVAGVPGNVEIEIAGWFARYRRVYLRPATLLHCPDRETADRVGAASKAIDRLSDTVLEISNFKGQPALWKKLRELGIFVGP